MNRRPPKKTETVEVRLPHAAKVAFMARCRAEGRTASDAIRDFIEAETLGRRQTLSAGWKALLAAVLAGLALGAAAPSLARGLASDRVDFEQLDRNGDGVLSFQEFRDR